MYLTEGHQWGRSMEGKAVHVRGTRIIVASAASLPLTVVVCRSANILETSRLQHSFNIVRRYGAGGCDKGESRNDHTVSEIEEPHPEVSKSGKSSEEVYVWERKVSEGRGPGI